MHSRVFRSPNVVRGFAAIVGAALVCWAATRSAKADWPQWRGPKRDSIADRADLPSRFDRAPARVWSQPLGTGWSSPVVSQGVAICTDRQGEQERVVAFDAATGRQLWSREHPVDFDPHAVGRQHGNGPKSTPVIAGQRVYALGIAGWLECLDLASGKTIWQRFLPADFGQARPLPGGRAIVEGTEHVLTPIGQGQGAPAPLFGYTGSMLVAEGKLVLEVGGARGGTLMAFDAETGAARWQALREHVSYSSPIAAVIAGEAQVIAMTGPRVVGLSLADGALRWSHPFQIQYDESISTPSVAGPLVLVTGDRRPLTALRVPDNKATGVAQASAATGGKLLAWENRDLSSYLSTMVVHDGHVYGMNDGGQFACVSLADGRTLWEGGDDGYYCSPVLAGNVLLGLNERGLLQVIAASPEKFQRLAQHQLTDEATWTMPAVVGHRLYVRGEKNVHCFEWPRE